MSPTYFDGYILIVNLKFNQVSEETVLLPTSKPLSNLICLQFNLILGGFDVGSIVRNAFEGAQVVASLMACSTRQLSFELVNYFEHVI